ncbi:YkyA family protein [Thermaerobacillus caldiproteolyticus]|uniref:Chromosome segregation ATPase n=1 Tax=Thermaerobacillus caldiproteolyticus TaxID=247480 RepID=A0A7V9Z4X9_9BACL|nr:YkyA family protein [Anoxybacillus caldiproteolyticus]MBA2874152.1 chromosome segregation ATPase [Anoxybacillus caldiproteolyticus]
MKVGKWSFIFAVIIILLQACNVLAPENELLSSMEKIAKYERNLNEEQTVLAELEQKQMKLYNEMMSYGMKQFPKVARLSKEALQILDDREKYIKKEYKTVQLAKEQLNIAKDNLSNVRDEEMKQQANGLIDVAIQRYEAYEELYQSYRQALTLEKVLYQLLQNQHATLQQLQKQIEQINNVYKEVNEANNKFNLYTEKYNKEKKRLYNELES